MKMRHFWRWPVLCSMLFGLAAAGTAAGVQAAPTAPGAASRSAEPASRLAYDARLHGRMAAIRAGLVEARKAQYRPAALRSLATKVEYQAGRIVEEFQAAATPAALEGLVADLYAGADDLKHTSKSVRSDGLRRLDGALREYNQRFDHPYETVS
jgi:hypothetical protein